MDSATSAPGRWFAVIAMKYFEGGGFWDRDAGMYLRGFQALGIDSRFVAFGEPCVSSDRPLILCSSAQMEDPDWWRRWGLEGVVLYSWGLPRYTGIIRALKQAGVRVVLVLDTDGLMLPQLWRSRYIEIKYHYAKGTGSLFPGLEALARTWLASFKGRQRDLIGHLEYAHRIALPSPIALQRYARFLIAMGRPDLVNRLVMVHHPVVGEMRYTPETIKQPVIIAVGTWDRHVKGAPLLVGTLAEVLERESEYSAQIIGPGESVLRRLMESVSPGVRARIRVLGPVSHDRLPQHYQESQVCVSTSSSESFGIACAEALCCGCSVVGLGKIGSMLHFCSDSCGTAAANRSVGTYTDAVLAEINAWRQGERDPNQISATWRRRCHIEAVARAVVTL